MSKFRSANYFIYFLKLTVKIMYVRKSNITKTLLLLTAFLISSCGDGSLGPQPMEPTDPGGDPGGSDQPIPDGIWIQKGFGRALNVTGEQVTFYDYTRETCLKNSSPTQDELLEIINIESVSSDELIASEDSGILVFSKRDALPPACLDHRLITENGPVATLRHFISNFSDYYPFFEARGITNWNERVRNAELRVTDQTSNEELLAELIELLSGLDDSHVTISDNTNFEFSAGSESGKLVDVLVTGFENQSEFTDVNEYVDTQFQRLESIRNSYFDEDTLRTADGEEEEVFVWATIGNGRVGYLEVKSMIGISANSAENDIMATEDLVDQILTDFANTEALIINLTVNGGGDLSIADLIANRFTAESVSVSSYAAISYDDSSMPQRTDLVQRDLAPTERIAYIHPVATISGPNTFSAAEHFLLSMRALKYPVCFIGEPSDGVLSAILDKPLPTEGWQLGITNMIVYDHTGQNFEVSGVPVDIEAVTFAVVDSNAERNEALDAALIALGFGWLINSNSQANDCAFNDARTRLELSAP